MRPTLAVWKFASCDGCQLSLLDCEDELLAVADLVEIRHFLEATSAVAPGPYDVSLVEGSITTDHDIDRIRGIREQSRLLVAIGACATAGGIQALRNRADLGQYVRAVYPRPEYISSLDTATSIADHVRVDLELRGCPIDRGQLLQTLVALCHGVTPRPDTGSVCVECKRRGTHCLLVAGGQPCLGPVTQAGCGALCPAFDRGCFGCFGPAESANLPALRQRLRETGTDEPTIDRLLATFTVTQFVPVPDANSDRDREEQA